MTSNSTSEKTAQKPKRSRSRILLPRLGEILLLVVAVFCLAVLITQDLKLVTRFIYSPLAVILLIVVFVEFLIIKGGDRSRLYRIELDRMREREDEQVTRARQAVAQVNRGLDLCKDRLKAEDADASDRVAAADEVEECLVSIGKLLRPDLKE